MKLIHSMIRVLDDARSIAFYGKAFGLKVKDRYDFASFSLIYLTDDESGFELELTVNKGRDEAYTLGDGYGHLAVSVEDIEGLHARLLAADLTPTPLKSMEHDGKPLARFFFLTDPDGYKIEVLQRGGRYQ
ncbi:VOC family protein [Acidisoma cellulosilytica]|uniref:Aldoketomutase n=1 Tax=Acidisoma cellulosilyticum TaxID=2802395 RepID=A0A963Z615_9PROT|nr:VOC family protein [Acidisoma cellulosilyticum]MCB8883555.1 VOC family protein [Acidisoma cellulosilyticum]